MKENIKLFKWVTKYTLATIDIPGLCGETNAVFVCVWERVDMQPQK